MSLALSQHRIMTRLMGDESPLSNHTRQMDSPSPSEMFIRTVTANGQTSWSCRHCGKSFWSEDALRKHLLTHPLDKSFTCEICDKSFRFRSNLAEHRSVHTSLKPYVCKYCGKSSRLKGNLTKHILKHHKSEQEALLGKDEIIIKKGKKSVKDPMAVDFIEKSMIVVGEHDRRPLTQQTSTPKASVQITTSSLGADVKPPKMPKISADPPQTQQRPSWLNGVDNVTASGLEDAMTAAGLHAATAMPGIFGALMAGANGGTLDLAQQLLLAQQQQLVQHHNTQLSLTNGRHSNAEAEDSGMDADDSEMLPVETASNDSPAPTTTREGTDTPGTPTTNINGSAAGGTQCQLCQKHFRKGRNLNLHMTLKHGYPPRADDGSDDDQRTTSSTDTCGGQQQPPTTPTKESHNNNNVKVSPTTSQPPPLKHHPVSSNATITSKPLMNGDVKNELSQLTQQLRNIREQTVDHNKSANNTSATQQQHQQTNNNNNNNNTQHQHLCTQCRPIFGEILNRLESDIGAMDARVEQLEKQVETVLTTMYTLVQLQTGMNQTLQQFKEDAHRQLRNINELVSTTVVEGDDNQP